MKYCIADKYGWPVERFLGRKYWLVNLLRLIILGRQIRTRASYGDRVKWN